MLRRLLLLSVVVGCLLPAVEYQAASEAEGPLNPDAPPECADPGDCCAGAGCMLVPPPGEPPPVTEALPPVVPVVPAAPLPRCDDGLMNQEETDVDCGGTCEATCAREQRCRGDQDCAQGLFCPDVTRRCTEASCGDGVQNGSEVQTDCGGGGCPGCPEGEPCQTPADCQSGVCSLGNCVAPTCVDGVVNGNETDVDCGGACGNCPTGSACADASDCQSGVCASAGCANGVQLCCQAPSCSDGVRNGNEPVPDCGNAACGLCPLGSDCSANQQCQTGLCQQGGCRELVTCTDDARNGTETDVDCGGSSCPRCADRSNCAVDNDCVNANCVSGVCISCGDGVLDGTETDIDCGGSDPFCARCVPGRRCLINSDCVDQLCVNGFC